MNKDGTLYIFHPLRLGDSGAVPGMMKACTENEHIVAITNISRYVLHDTVENTNLTLDEIQTARLKNSDMASRKYSTPLTD